MPILSIYGRSGLSGLGGVCDPADIAEGLCDPNIGSPDYSVTGTSTGTGESTTNLSTYFSDWGSTPPTPAAAAIANAALLAQAQSGGAAGGVILRPATNAAPVCGINSPGVCFSNVASFVSRYSSGVVITLALMVLLTSIGGGPGGFDGRKRRR